MDKEECGHGILLKSKTREYHCEICAKEFGVYLLWD